MTIFFLIFPHRLAEVFSSYSIQPRVIETVKKGHYQWQIGEQVELWYGSGWAIGKIFAIKPHTLLTAICGQATQAINAFILNGGVVNSRPVAPMEKLRHSWRLCFVQVRFRND